MGISSIEFPVNCIRLCFDDCEDGSYKGRIYGVALEKEIQFEDPAELIIIIDDAFNQIGQPQPHQILRSFQGEETYQPYNGHPRRCHSNEEVAEKKGTMATCDLIMMTRHCAEWQGIIKSPEGSLVGHFSSSLACIELLETVLEDGISIGGKELKEICEKLY